MTTTHEKHQRFLDAIANDAFSHSRKIMFRDEPVGVAAYAFDSGSPSAVTFSASLMNYDDAIAALKAAGRPAPYPVRA